MECGGIVAGGSWPGVGFVSESSEGLKTPLSNEIAGIAGRYARFDSAARFLAVLGCFKSSSTHLIATAGMVRLPDCQLL